MFAEQLEDRRLLATTALDLTGGILTYTGDANTNELSISVANNVYSLTPGAADTIDLTNGDSVTANVPETPGAPVTIGSAADDITSIVVHMLDAADRVTILSSDDPVTIHGGLDDDTFAFGDGFGNVVVVEHVGEGLDTIDFTAHTGTLSVTSTVLSNDTIVSSDGSMLSQTGEVSESLDIRLTPVAITEIQSGLDDIDKFVQDMQLAGGDLAKLTNNLPLLKSDVASGVADVAGMTAAFSEMVDTVKSEVVGKTTLGEVTTALDALTLANVAPLDTLSLSVTSSYRGEDADVPGGTADRLELLLDFQLDATTANQTYELDLGEDAQNLGWDVPANVSLNSALDALLTLGLSTGTATPDVFLTPGGTIAVSVDAASTITNVPLTVGLLDVMLDDGTLELDGQVDVTLVDDAVADERIAVGTPSFDPQIVSVAASDPDTSDGYLAVDTTISVPPGVEVGTIDLSSATITLGLAIAGDPFGSVDGSAEPHITLTATADEQTSDLLIFGNAGPNDVIRMLGGVADMLTTLGHSPLLATSIPFTGLTLGDGLDFAGSFKDVILDSLFVSGDISQPDVDGDGDVEGMSDAEDGDPADLTFSSIQELLDTLQVQVNAALGLPTETELKAHYDPIGHELTFTIGFEQTVQLADGLTLDFGASLGELANIETSGTVGATANLNAGLSFGIDLDPSQAVQVVPNVFSPASPELLVAPADTATDKEIQTVRLAHATAGTFRLSYKDDLTTAIPYNATAAEVETALDGLSVPPASSLVSVTKSSVDGAPLYTVTFDVPAEADELLIGDATELRAAAEGLLSRTAHILNLKLVNESYTVGSLVVAESVTADLNNVEIAPDNSNSTPADLVDDVQAAINGALVANAKTLGFLSDGQLATGTLTSGDSATGVGNALTALSQDLGFDLRLQLDGGATDRTLRGTVRAVDVLDGLGGTADGVLDQAEIGHTLTGTEIGTHLAPALQAAINQSLDLGGITGFDVTVTAAGETLIVTVNSVPEVADTLSIVQRSLIQVDGGGGRVSLSAPAASISTEALEPPIALDRFLQTTVDFDDPAYQELGLLSAPTRHDGTTHDRIEFQLLVDGTSVDVALDPAVRNDVDQLVTDLQAAVISGLTDATLASDLVEVFRLDPQGNRIGLRGEVPSVTTLSMDVPDELAGDVPNGAVTELGFEPGQSANKRGRATEFFIQDVGLTADLALVAQDVSVTGTLGFLALTATGAGTLGSDKFVEAHLQAGLKDPVDGDTRLTFDVLTRALHKGNFLFHAVDVGGTADDPGTGILDGSLLGNVGMRLDIAPDGSLAGLANTLNASIEIIAGSPDWLVAPPSLSDPLGMSTQDVVLTADGIELQTSADVTGQLTSNAGFIISDGTQSAAGALPFADTTPDVTVRTTTPGSATANEVQVVPVSNASGGTFTLSYNGSATADINYAAPATGADSVQAALQSLPGVENVDVTKTIDDGAQIYEITFQDPANTNVGQLVGDASKLTRTRADLQADLQAAVDATLALLGSGAIIVSVDDGTGEITLSSADALAIRSTQVDVSFAGPDFDGLLSKFRDLSFADVIDGLQLVVDLFQGLEESNGPGSDAIEFELPLIDRSISDLIDTTDGMLSMIEAIEANPAGSVQELNQVLVDVLGLPATTTIVSLDTADASGPILNLDFLFETGVALSSPFVLDLAEAGLPEFLTDLVGVSAAGNLSVKANASLDVKFGLDLSGNDKSFFLHTGPGGTKLSATASGTGAPLDFSAQIGPFGLYVIDGSAAVNGGLTIELADPDADGRLSLVEFGDSGASSDLSRLDEFVDTDTVVVTGTATANLPLYVGTEDDPIPLDFAGANPGTNNALSVTADLVEMFDGAGDGDSGITFTLPDFDFGSWEVPSLLGLLADPAIVVDGLDVLLQNVQNALNGEVFGVELPFIGDLLADNPATNIIDDFRDDWLKPLANTLRENNLNLQGLVGLIQETVASVFEPNDFLKDSNNDGLITTADVVQTGFDPANPQDTKTHLQFDFEIGQTLVFTADQIEFDLGIPALGIEAEFTPRVTLDWTMHVGFGVDQNLGFYLVADHAVSDVPTPEMWVEVTVDFGSSANDRASAEGRLLFLAMKLQDGVDVGGDGLLQTTDPVDHKTEDFSKLYLQGTIDIAEPSGDGRLTVAEAMGAPMNEIIRPELTGGAMLRAEAEVDFSTLDASLQNVLPSISTSILIDYRMSATPADGFVIEPPQAIFADISLDLGSFISEYAGPILTEVGDIIEPLDWLLGPDGFLNSRIPLISDLAGTTITGKDLILKFDPKHGPSVVAVLDAIETLYFLTRLVSDAATEANGSSIEIEFGDLVISDSPDIPQPNIVDQPIDLNLPDLRNLKNLKNVTVPKGNAAALPPATGSKTKRFAAGVTDPGGINFALFQPDTVFKLLLGQPDVTLLTYQLPKMEFDFFYRQSFPIFGPIVGTFAGGVGGGVDLGFGYDTRGLSQFLVSDNPQHLINGFFISDVDFATGLDRPEAFLSAEIAVGAGLDLGIVSAGVEGGIDANIDFNLADLDGDTKVRLDELAGNIAANDYNPMAIFDTRGIIEFFLRAYYEINLLFTSISDSYEFTRLTLYEFDISYNRPSVLGSVTGDTLTLNVGPNAASRLNGNTVDGDERIYVKSSGGGVVVWSDDFHVSESIATISPFVGVKRVVVNSGDGNDLIDLSRLTDTTIVAEVNGGPGNDTIIGGAGNDLLVGGRGNDRIAGGGGSDEVRGGEGNDLLGKYNDSVSEAGKDWLFGGPGNDTLNSGAGNDVLDGGTGDDTFARSIGNDLLDLFNAGSTELIDGSSGSYTLDFSDKREKLTFFLQDDKILVGFGKQHVGSDEIRADVISSDKTYFDHQVFVNDAANVVEIKGGALGDTFHVMKSSNAIVLNGDKGNDTYLFYTGTNAIDVNVNDTGDPWNSGDVISVVGSNEVDDITVRKNGLVLNSASTQTVSYTVPLDGNQPITDGNVVQIKVAGNGGADVFKVESTSPSIPVHVSGGADADTVTVGDGSVAEINGISRPGLNAPYGLGPLVLVGGDGDDTVIIDDSEDTTGDLATLTAFLETREGLTEPVQVGVISGLDMSLQVGTTTSNGRVEFEGFETVDLRLGAGADDLTVGSDTIMADLPQNRQTIVNEFVDTITGTTLVDMGPGDDTVMVLNTNAESTVQISGDAGTDVVNVRAMAGSVTLNGGGQDDTLNIGSLAPETTGGIVDDINGLLTIAGQDGSDTLNVDDSGDTTDNVATLTENSLVGLEMADDDPTKGLRYTDLEFLNLGFGSGADVANVQGTSAISNLALAGGDDAVFVSSTAAVADVAATEYLSGTVDRVQATLNLDAGAGQHILMISDVDATTSDTDVTVNSTSVDGLAPALITYDADLTSGNFGGGVTIWSGASDDAIHVNSTHARGELRTVTTLNTSSGMDSVTVDLHPSDGFFVLNTQTGDDTIDASTSTTPLILFAGDGNDDVQGSQSNDLIFGDRGVAEFNDVDGSPVMVLGHGGVGDRVSRELLPLSRATTRDPAVGGNDTIQGELGGDIVLGGPGRDTITAGGDTLPDVILGDLGEAVFFPNAQLAEITSIDTDAGDDDQLVAGDGINVLVGGSGSDQINGGAATDVVLGDHGRATFDTDGTLTRIESVAPAEGTGDVIVTGSAFDVIIGGVGDDVVDTGSDAARDIVIGDNGLALFDSVAGSSLLRQIETSEPTSGGADMILAGNGSDVVMGGSGSDDIEAGTDASRDILVGDNGSALFDIDGVLTSIATTDPTIGGDDQLLAGDGSDVVLGGKGSDYISVDRNTGLPVGVDTGNDVIMGDNGSATFFAFQGASVLKRIETSDPEDGDGDYIFASDGADVILGGNGPDQIEAGTDASPDVIVGDNGFADFDNANGTHLLRHIETTEALFGERDLILAGDGPDVVLGGSHSDDIEAGTDTSRDILVGDNGRAIFDADGVLIEIRTLDPAVGGDDQLLAGDGSDVVLGGKGIDHINIDRDTGLPVGVDTGDDVILGDNGFASFFAVQGQSVLQQIRTSDALEGDTDYIFASDGSDVVLGGSGSDDIDAGSDSSRDILVGDNGSALFDTDGVLMSITTTDPAIGGDDQLQAGDGSDVVLGGKGIDHINIDPDTGQPVGVDTGDDVILGDNGSASFLAFQGVSVLQRIETSDPADGDGDFIFASDGADVVLGGSGPDQIDAGTDASSDVVVGDNGHADFDGDGVLTDIRTRDPEIGDDDFIITGGGPDVILGGQASDEIQSGTGDDVILGDNGFASFTDGELAHLEITDPHIGGSDLIDADTGDDRVIGGAAMDDITTDTGRDVVLGDNGLMVFDGDSDLSTLDFVTTNFMSIGDVDTIDSGEDGDVVLGGTADDAIDAGLDDANDIVVGDGGNATFTTGVLTDIRTTDPDIGGDDDIVVGEGDDVVLGGLGADFINAARPSREPLGSDQGRDVIVGDNGFALFEASAGKSLIRQVETSDPEFGGADVIFAADGPDVVFGGSDSDVVDAGTDESRDIVVGDNGTAAFSADDVLTFVSTTAPEIGGSDTIWTRNGPDVVLGGVDNDMVDAGSDAAGDTSRDVVVGDNGLVVLSGAGDLNRVRTSEPAIGGDDVIATGGGDDLIFGGAANDVVMSGLGNDVVVGDSGIANFTDIGELTDVATAAPQIGGADVVHADGGEDVVFGGMANDEIHGGEGRDILFGDNAFLDNLASDTDPASLDLVSTTFPIDGGEDDIYGDAGMDHIFGGTSQDTISGGDDHDVILGDHGLMDRTLPVNQNFQSTFITDDQAPGADTIHGDGGDDFILGQQGEDVIFGDDGEDDIWGGHNVRFGDDGDDTIDGGPAADVVLGENGIIIRSLQPNEDDQWERHPEPFPDVIRDLTRFDDLDRIKGDDTILGDSGDDIIHGQRGHDTIGGGSGDDELYGELGNDTMTGDEGHDVMLADVGLILRDFTQQGNPRLNDNGWWHRDVFLEEVGELAGLIDVDQTPLRTPDPQLAEKLLRTDLLVGAGSYEEKGTKLTNNDTGAWDTDLLLVDLVPGNTDSLDGGLGEDFIFGQRGNDILRGGGGDDLVIGDDASNSVPLLTESPHIWSGVRLIDIHDGVSVPFELPELGTVIIPPLTLEAEELRLNDPYDTPNLFGNVVADVIDDLRDENGADWLPRTDGGYMRPFVSIVPDVIHHVDVLPGADEIYGDDGDDFIVGDRINIFSPLLSGMQVMDDALDAARDAFDRVMHTLGSVSLDYENLQQLRAVSSLPHDIHVGQDTIDGGEGRDTINADTALIIPTFELGLPLTAERFGDGTHELHDYLADLAHLGTDLEHLMFETHYQVLRDLLRASGSDAINPQVDPDHHDLYIGNDVIAGANGDDLIHGDHGVILTPVVTGERFQLIKRESHIDPQLWDGIEAQVQNSAQAYQAELSTHVDRHHNQQSRNIGLAALSRIAWDYEYELFVGNDIIDGNEGNDLLIGDFGAFAAPVILDSPTTLEERVVLEHDIKELTDDAARYLETRHHWNHFDPLHEQYTHPHFNERGGDQQEVRMVAGQDLLRGGSDNDFILGDSDSVAASYRYDDSQRFDEPDPEFKVNFLVRENYELIEHYIRAGAGSSVSTDEIHGGPGNDYVYGQYNDDILFGDDGNDIVFGGSGQNSADGGSGTNDVRAGSDDRPEETLLDVLEDYVFNRYGPWTLDLINDVGAQPLVDLNPLRYELRHGNFINTIAADDVSSPPDTGGGDGESGEGEDLVGRTGGTTWWSAVSDGSSFTNVRHADWVGGTWEPVLAGDVNGDGWDDLLAMDDGAWSVALATGGGNYVSETWGAWPPGRTWVDVQIGDVNGDGMADIVGRSNGEWWVARSTGTSFAHAAEGRWSTRPEWHDVQVADVNGDGMDDIVGRVGSGRWWVARATGTRFVNEAWGAWDNLGWQDVRVADVNGDSLDDVVGRDQNGRWFVARSTGSTFVNEIWGRWSATVSWVDVLIADLDGDGRDDIVGRANGAWWVARSTGSGFVNERFTRWSRTVDWLDVNIADVNDDGRDDIVGRSSADGVWWVALSTEQGAQNETWGRWSPNHVWLDVLVGNFG